MIGSKILFAHRKRLINVRLENFGPAAWQGFFIGDEHDISRRVRLPY